LFQQLDRASNPQRYTSNEEEHQQQVHYGDPDPHGLWTNILNTIDRHDRGVHGTQQPQEEYDENRQQR